MTLICSSRCCGKLRDARATHSSGVVRHLRLLNLSSAYTETVMMESLFLLKKRLRMTSSRPTFK